MKQPILKFKNFEFKDGINLTVRRGIKWATLKNGGINISTLDGNKSKVGIIKDTSVIKFSDLTDKDLELEHDELCRFVDPLFQVMSHMYYKFNRNEIVTLVYFEILED